jgi:hypothetical protein
LKNFPKGSTVKNNVQVNTSKTFVNSVKTAILSSDGLKIWLFRPPNPFFAKIYLLPNPQNTEKNKNGPKQPTRSGKLPNKVCYFGPNNRFAGVRWVGATSANLSEPRKPQRTRYGKMPMEM